MSTDESKVVEDQVDRAILRALRQRADPGVSSSEEEDEALISAVVAAHLQAVQRQRIHKNTTWLAAAGLLAAAAVAALWLRLPADPGGTLREARTAIQAETGAPTQAMWVLEDRGTPLEGIVVAPGDREVCGTRNDTRACLTAGSRGAFEPDGNLRLHEGSARVEAGEPIILFLADARVQAAADTANFSATYRAGLWTVSVEDGVVTMTGPDGAQQVLETGESAGSGSPEMAETVDPETATALPHSDAKHNESTHKPSAASKKPAPSADALLKLARSQRAARDFAAAARTYEQLVRAYPNSAKVRATLVSLAQLYQGPLDDPAKALRYFDRYLKRGGLLAEEAHYGKIRALRSLGRSDAANSEIDAFLRTYPDSAYADALRGK